MQNHKLSNVCKTEFTTAIDARGLGTSSRYSQITTVSIGVSKIRIALRGSVGQVAPVAQVLNFWRESTCS